MVAAKPLTLGVIGAGAWGTALAINAARAGHQTLLWARQKARAAEIAKTHTNERYLPGIDLPGNIEITATTADLAQATLILLVVPAQQLRAIMSAALPTLGKPKPLVICAKGIEVASGQLMSEVMAEIAPGWPLAVLSGPNLAGEVAHGLPAAATLACTDRSVGTKVLRALASRTFRPYLSDDPLGAEVGGAVKNVIAIACGVASGMGLGENARAALITRGLAEMVRLGLAKGGRAETLMGLSGMGDLILTATSESSRNFSFGRALGEGKSITAVLKARKGVTEGYLSAPAVAALARKLKVVMPIAEAVDQLVSHAITPKEALDHLLNRPYKSEV